MAPIEPEMRDEYERQMRERQEAGGSPSRARVSLSKPLMGHEFVEAMEKAGLLPKYTTSVHIKAEVGDVVEMRYTCFVEKGKMIEAVSGMRTPDEGESPGVAR